MQSKSLIALAFAVATTTPFHVLAQESEPKPLRIATSFEVANMNPFQEGFWMPEFGVGELLMQFRADGQVHPWLLESLENIDDLTWRLTLREGVNFQNGKPLNAEAVLAAINEQLENSTATQSAVPGDAQFSVTGPYELTVTTKEPWPVLPSVLASEAAFLIYDVEAVAAVGENYEQLIGAGIYTGPYEVVALGPNEMVLDRFEDYWQGEPALPGVTVSFVTDPNARILSVQNGEADIALYPPVAAKAMVDATPGIHFIVGAPGTGGFLGFFDVRTAPLDDIRVRQAVMKAINYEHLTQTALGGVFGTPTSLYSEAFPWAVQNYETDLQAAGELLDAAGWTLGRTWRERDGKRLTLNVLIYPQQPDLVPISSALQAQLREVGIEVTIQSVDDIYAAVADSGINWQIAISGESTAGLGNPQTFLNRYVMPGAARNFSGYGNEEVGRLIDELAATVNPDARNEILQRIQEILVDEDPYVIALTLNRGRVVVNDAYRTYQPGVANFHVAYDTAPADTAE